MSPSRTLDSIRPHAKPRLIDLVAAAGFDTSDWGSASNPKYCYEWCFEQEGMYVINIWLHAMKEEGDDIVLPLNMRVAHKAETGVRAARARRFDKAIRSAFESGSHPRAIVLDRSSFSLGRVERRMLDRAPWTVRAYDAATGAFELIRGIHYSEPFLALGAEVSSSLEGALSTSFIKHRARERRLRAAKLEEQKAKNNGRLVCEVPNCGFDFAIQYGSLGDGYAEVHHKLPLSAAPAEGVDTSLEDLAVVCANCHAMIHKGGECRALCDLIHPSESQ